MPPGNGKKRIQIKYINIILVIGQKMNENNDEYHEHKNTYQKKWRKNNPEKVKKYNLEKRQNHRKRYKVYKSRTERDGIDFELSFDEFNDLITKKCYYCHLPPYE